MAAWILDGDPGLDLWHMDVRRFGPEYRSPGYTLARVVENYETLLRHPAPGQPAIRGPAAADLAGVPVARRARRGVRREGRVGAGGVLRLRRAAPRADDAAARAAGPGTAGRRGSSPSTGRPARRRRCSTSRPSPRSRSAVRTRRGVRRARVRRPRRRAGRASVTYTQALDDRGGVAMDVTVTRVAPDAFLVVTGTASGRHDLALAARPGPADGARRCGSRTSPGPGRASGCGVRGRVTCWPR